MSQLSIAPGGGLTATFVYLGRSPAFGAFVAEFARAALRLDSHRFEFIVAKDSMLSAELARAGVNVLPIPTFASFSPQQVVGGFLRARRGILRHLAKCPPSAVVTLMPHVWSPLLAQPIRSLGIRYLTVVHDAVPHPGDWTAVATPWLLRDAKKADIVVTLSRAVTNQLSAGDQALSSKVVRLFHPDLTARGSLANRSLEPGRPLRILLFGRIMEYKGLSLLIDAVRLLRQDGVAVQLGVAGAGSLESDLTPLRQLGAEVINRWIAEDEVAEILARYDCMVCPYVEASQSGVAALAFGNYMPVVATPVGGIAEQVVTGQTGVLANAATSRALADGIHQLATVPGLYERISSNLANTSEDRSMKRFVSEIVATLNPAGEGAPLALGAGADCRQLATGLRSPG